MIIPMKMKTCKFITAAILTGFFCLAGSIYVNATGSEIPTETVTPDAKPIYSTQLSESYNSEYNLFEEGLENQYFLYTNVGNGAITSNSVQIDIPSNLQYTLEKDGAVIPYVGGTLITSMGNYVLRLTAEDETTIYQSTFRFSIRAQQAATTQTEQQEPTEEAESVLPEEIDEQENESEETTEENQQEEIAGYLGEKDYVYNPSGLYQYTLLSGESYFANVPNGAIVNESVSVTVPESMVVKIYKDDVEIDAQNEYTEQGSYRIVMSGSSAEYAIAYGLNEITFSFRIVSDAVGNMKIFNTPKGFVLSEVTKDFESIDLSGCSREHFFMDSDGVYVFTFTDPEIAQTFSTRVERDTQAPQYSIEIKNGKAKLDYISKDIETITLSKDGVLVETFSQYEISGKGSYVLTVIDKAGNESKFSFILAKSVNGATIISILLFLAIIGGIVYVMKKSKNSFKVR